MMEPPLAGTAQQQKEQTTATEARAEQREHGPRENRLTPDTMAGRRFRHPGKGSTGGGDKHRTSGLPGLSSDYRARRTFLG